MNDPQKWNTEQAALETFKTRYIHLSADAMESMCKEHLQTDEFELNHVLWYCRALVHQQNHAEMVTHAMQWLNRFPNSVMLVHELGKAWLQLGEIERAETLLRAALKVHPDELNLWCDIAEIHLLNNRLQAAADSCQLVLERDNDFARALELKERTALDQPVEYRNHQSAPTQAPPYTERIQSMIKLAMESRGQANERNIFSIHREAGWLMQVVFLLFMLGQRLCGPVGVLIWMSALVTLYIGEYVEVGWTWQQWIIAPQLLIVIVMAGWGLLFTMGTWLHRTLNTDRARPLWNHQWLWTLVPILIWTLLTSIRYSLGDSESSFAIDFIRSLSFCSIVPIFVWRKQAARRHPIAVHACLAWCAIVGLFFGGWLAQCPMCYGMGFVISSAITLLYMLTDWQK